ncbi:pentatricopeptide repeat-containing protein At2g41720 isoform X2 [Nymphaea colorata]|uniref:pentatricopeptide repeat-containing protein At2g41720 isoform X2 n=1 Tax=Nymphaea colorata TaxID=210225 RepID=UPI00214E5583|nr:pentatricopeptide repeat-containing protein At2g41720 isoform X2 [Nymphaea colorata]
MATALRIDVSQDKKVSLHLSISHHFHHSSLTLLPLTQLPWKHTTATPKPCIRCKKNAKEARERAMTRVKTGVVDYDRGKYRVTTQLSGYGRRDVPKRYRERYDGEYDWSITEVVSKVLKRNHWEDIEGILNHWIGRFARKNYPLLIRELSVTGSLEHCVHVFRWMKNQRNYCARKEIYNTMIRLHARHNQTDQARGLFFEMQKWSCKPDAESYNALINAHGRKGQWRWAMNIMDDMFRAAIPPSRSTYNNLINACGSSGNWQEAFKVCKRMTDNGVGPDLVTHNIILTALKNGGQYSKALSYFALMKGTNIRPDTVTYNIIIHCLIKLGQNAEAIDVFNSMRLRKEDCSPDIVTFTSIIHAYASCGQIESCKQTFDMMIAEGLIDEALEVMNEMVRDGVEPNVVTICTLLAACGRSGQMFQIDTVLLAASSRGIALNTAAYNSAIGSFMNLGEYDRALRLYRSMEEKKAKPNSITFNILISGCCRMGKYLKALKFFAQMRDLEILPSKEVYSSIIHVYCKQDQLTEAESIFATMKASDCFPDVVTYTTLIHAYSAAGNWEKVCSLYEEMEMNSILPDSVVCCTLMSAFNKEGHPEKVFQIAEVMMEKNLPLTESAFYEIASACSILRDWKAVLDLMKMMESSIPSFSQGFLNHLLLFLGRSGRIDAMMKLLYKVMESNVEVSFQTYSMVLKGLLGVGKWKKYIEVLHWMEDAKLNPSLEMYQAVLPYAYKNESMECDMLQQRIENMKTKKAEKIR